MFLNFWPNFLEQKLADLQFVLVYRYMYMYSCMYLRICLCAFICIYILSTIEPSPTTSMTISSKKKSGLVCDSDVRLTFPF